MAVLEEYRGEESAAEWRETKNGLSWGRPARRCLMFKNRKAKMPKGRNTEQKGTDGEIGRIRKNRGLKASPVEKHGRQGYA